MDLGNLEKENYVIKFLTAVLVVCFLLIPAYAQDTPKAEVFGGYQFTHADIEGVGLSFNGWNASVTGNVNKWFGVTGDFSGAYKSELGASLKVHTYAFGPTISVNHEGTVNPFVHVLFGGATASLSAFDIGGSTTGYTIMAGGGADAKLSPRLAVRVIQADWVYYHFEGIGLKKNIRVSTGIVLRF